MAIGTLLSVPVISKRVRTFHQSTYLVESFPADDKALQDWALTRPQVFSFQTERREKEFRIRSEAWGAGQHPPFAEVVSQLHALGYDFRGMGGGESGMASRFPELLTDAQVLAAMLAGMQVAFGGIGLLCIRRAARTGYPVPSLIPGRHLRAAGIGCAGGLVLLGLGHLYTLALTKLFGHQPPSPWDAAQAMPAQTKLVFLLFGGLGAPLTEELFFRGYIFGKFKAVGFVWFGLAVSSILFAVIHFSDPYGVPVIAIYGAVLAWIFHRSRSLLAPIIAHSVNNGVQILGMILS